jgi:hypothetical protein
MNKCVNKPGEILGNFFDAVKLPASFHAADYHAKFNHASHCRICYASSQI